MMFSCCVAVSITVSGVFYLLSLLPRYMIFHLFSDILVWPICEHIDKTATTRVRAIRTCKYIAVYVQRGPNIVMWWDCPESQCDVASNRAQTEWGLREVQLVHCHRSLGESLRIRCFWMELSTADEATSILFSVWRSRLVATFSSSQCMCIRGFGTNSFLRMQDAKKPTLSS